jgi:hypothetical protein
VAVRVEIKQDPKVEKAAEEYSRYLRELWFYISDKITQRINQNIDIDVLLLKIRDAKTAYDSFHIAQHNALPGELILVREIDDVLPVVDESTILEALKETCEG